jgi:DNA-binding NarL/FixJ family response regulator
MPADGRSPPVRCKEAIPRPVSTEEPALDIDLTAPDARVVIVDELPLVRHGARAVCDDLGYEVLGEYAAARDAEAICAANQVALVVLGTPVDASATVTTVRLKALTAAPAVVALVAARNHGEVAGLISAGAEVLVGRDLAVEELASALSLARSGGRLVAPLLQRALLGAAIELTDEGGGAEGDGVLSSREREVLACLAAGRTNREIATALSLSLATVKSHLVRVYAKLGVSDRTGAVRAAVAQGILG